MAVPDRKTTLEGFDAEAVRAQGATTHVSGPYVEASDLNMAGPNLVVGDEQHLPTRGHIPKGERAELRDIGVVENGGLVVGGQDGGAVQGVVLCQPYTFCPELQGSGAQRHPRWESDHRRPADRPLHLDDLSPGTDRACELGGGSDDRGAHCDSFIDLNAWALTVRLLPVQGGRLS